MATFECDMCHKTYTKARTDEEALKDAKQYFTDAELKHAAILCEDCWLQIEPARKWLGIWRAEQALEEGS